MPGWAVRTLSDIPTVTDGDPGDLERHPLQHFFGLTAFGANVFVAKRGDETLVGEHDEQASGQEELYLVLDSEAEFELDGERVHATRGDRRRRHGPEREAERGRSLRRSHAPRGGLTPRAFATTWRESHFADLPRAAR